MSRLWNYLVDPAVTPGTRSCRIKVWAHDHAFTVLWLTSMNAVGWIVTVIQCH